tara:strand:+ start:48099 stop:49085 length:987 start_codon:yes stop_codon:yes gene_type:complete
MAFLVTKYLSPSRRQIFSFVTKFAVSGILAWWLIGQVDISESADRLAKLDLVYGFLALLSFIALIAISSIRWHILCRALSINIHLINTIRINFVANFLGQVLPAGIGIDAVKVWIITKKGASAGQAVSGVALDRLIGLAALLLLIAVFLPFLFLLIEDNNARIAIILILVAGVGALSFIFLISMIPKKFGRFSTMRKIASDVGNARKVLLSPRPSLLTLFSSLIIHFFSILVIHLLSSGIGIEINFLTLMTLIPPVMLLATLPISVAGWGVREGAMVAALGYIGINSGDALALSVLFGFVTIAASIPGALLWIAIGHKQDLKDRMNTK